VIVLTGSGIPAQGGRGWILLLKIFIFGAHDCAYSEHLRRCRFPEFGFLQHLNGFQLDWGLGSARMEFRTVCC
jgi:hypothetical protein